MERAARGEVSLIRARARSRMDFVGRRDDENAH